jgi:hypothetical protein
MSRGLKESLPAIWRDRLARQATSGLTVAEFCRREGVSVPSWYHWRKRLGVKAQASSANGRSRRSRPSRKPRARKPASDPPGAAGLARGSDSLSVEGPGFVPVSLPASPSSPWIELILADGSVIRLPQQNLRALELVLLRLTGRSGRPQLGEVHHA